MKFLILGGTGTLGRALTDALLMDEYTEVTCFSRDELKQAEMAKLYPGKNLRFVIGDIRDRNALMRAMRDQDVVFHVAALKHIDVLELNPEESVQTNVIATINVADAAIECGVKHVVFSSTDKAVEPINVYGMSKGISEKILLRRNQTQKTTHFSVFRWGNVVGSRGSVISSFVKTLKGEGRAYVTSLDMTRFWIKIEDAVSFMLQNYKTAEDIQIPPIAAASVLEIVDAVSEVLGLKDYEVVFIGKRPGEKSHEALKPDMRSDNWTRYEEKPLQDLIRPVVEACR